MNHPLRKLRHFAKAWQIRRAQACALADLPAEPPDISPAHWPDGLRDPTSFYLRCFQFFHTALPRELREHRAFFSAEGRGFGEDAFHVQWYLLFTRFRPATFLEIGVYRGQTLSLAALLARSLGFPCRVAGVSPFSPAGDSVSHYADLPDYQRDTLAHFAHFNLPPPDLLKAYSTDPAAEAFIAASAWDMIYIDGNHDIEVVRRDWALCARQLKPGGVIVLDDSGLSTAYHPPLFATGGHPGPSQMVEEIDQNQFREILQVGHNRAFQKVQP